MGEWSWLIILFWYSQKLMRIYCIEKKPVKFNDLHICSFFTITDCDQNYMQMLNHQINDKKSVGLCSLFSFFFLSSILGLVHNISIISIWNCSTVFFSGFCRLSLKTPWRKVWKTSGFGGPASLDGFVCGRRKADSFKNIWQYKNISEFV